jgi:pheromone a factor receptor
MSPILGLTFRFLLEHRARFRSTLSNGSGAISSSRYLRLLALVGVEMICTLPLSLWAIFSSTAGVPLAPWISWEDTHYNFGRIKQIPAVLWRMNATQERAIELQRWLYPVTALIFFALFGIAGEARVHYRSGFLCVARLFGYQPPAPRAPYKYARP